MKTNTHINRNEATTEEMIRLFFEQEYGNVADMYIERTSDNVLTVFGYDADFGADTRLDELRITEYSLPEQEFVIFKKYEGFPSKNSVQFRGTEEECKDMLQNWIGLSKRNGAEIVSEDEYQYTCDNYDNNGATVIFEIK